MTRNHFALARLIALVVKKNWPGSQPVRLPPGVDRVILNNDRHQSSAENYTAAFGYQVLVACFLAALMPWVAAILLAPIVLEIPIYVFGVPSNSGRVVSAGYVLCGAAMSWVLVLQPRWIRFAGWAFFAVLALNAFAFVILWPLRNRIR